MRILVTGVTGYVGRLMAARLARDGHQLVGFARRADSAPPGLSVVTGDAFTGAGLERALHGVDVAYFLIHSMEPVTDPAGEGIGFSARERVAAQRFADAAAVAGVRRIVYLGGMLPAGSQLSPHLASRLAVE
ncbi:MAG: NAD(P)H-binding protein, partial [Solirubrobacteraceae bacterium]